MKINKQVLGIIFLAVIMAALPLHLRLAQGNHELPGIAPYYHALHAIQLTHGYSSYDNTIVNGREYTLNPYHILLALFYMIMGTAAFFAVPLLCALASFYLFWKLLGYLKFSQDAKLGTLLVYTLSPSLIAIATLGTPHSFVIMLTLLAACLLFTRYWTTSIALIILISLTGTVYTIGALFTMFALYLLTKKQHIIYAAVAAALSIFLPHATVIPLPQTVTQFISDFGGIYGFSIFALLLAIVGTTLVWEHKKQYYATFTLILAGFIATFYYPHLIIFANLVISALAGEALAKLSNRTWNLHYLRNATLLVLFCGLLFSGIAHAKALASLDPQEDFFANLPPEHSTIFTHENYGFWLSYAGHTPVIDPLWTLVPDPDEQYGDAMTLFRTIDIETANALIKKYNITHILITNEMHGLVWERDDQGLAFLVGNSETFKSTETGKTLTVWKTP